MKKRTLSWEMQGQTLHLHSFSFPPSFPDGRGSGSARRGQRTENARETHGEHNMPQADATPHFGDRKVAPSGRHHRRDLLPRSRTERKPAKVVFPVRCTKAAGRRNVFIGWHRLCKDERMRPTYRRRAVKFRGWFGCRRVRRKSEAKPADMDAAWWRLSLDKAAV